VHGALASGGLWDFSVRRPPAITVETGQKGRGMKDILHELEDRRAAARLGGGQKRIDAQHGRAS
jgi:hypothetical protein